jgi:hypothetical protein
VEQKNGSVVRRLVGYGRLSGTDARNALAQLYASSRLYINFFQLSFKLKSKTRDGARVHKVYFAPATPCDRLLAHDSVEPAIKEKLKAQFKGLDPVRLLQEMRTAQQILSDFAAHGVRSKEGPTDESDVAVFLASLSSAWKEGEARPTHRKQPKAKHWWRSRVDPFADAWPLIEGWLMAEPSVPANVLIKGIPGSNLALQGDPEFWAGWVQPRPNFLDAGRRSGALADHFCTDRLAAMFPEAYASQAKLRTLQRRVKAWRAERVKELILGGLRKSAAMPVEA